MHLACSYVPPPKESFVSGFLFKNIFTVGGRKNVSRELATGVKRKSRLLYYTYRHSYVRVPSVRFSHTLIQSSCCYYYYYYYVVYVAQA